MAINPRERFGIPLNDGFSVWDLESEYTIDPNDFLSMGRATPFEGRRVFGKNVMTFLGEEKVFENV